MRGDVKAFQRLGRAATAGVLLFLAACAAETDSGTPPPEGAPPPPTVSDTPTAAEASRFLIQATFGPTEAEINELVRIGYSDWFRNEFDKPLGNTVNQVRQLQADYAARDEFLGTSAIADVAWRAMIENDDQLRQRMVYALSQILVISYNDSNVGDVPAAVAYYIDVLNRGAFGNYRTLLEDVTYSPSMAAYLTYLNNAKEDPETGRVPDENYARELMQLFTIGLVELNADGSPRLDGSGAAIETYTNDDITGLARVFTGLSWDDERFGGRLPQQSFPVAAYSALRVFPEEHSTSEKVFLGTTIPANTGPEASIDAALDRLFTHPNVGPFIGRQLIQRFVTSNPSPDYIARVTAAYNTGWFRLPDGGSVGASVRGDMRAVIAAVLLDPEARDITQRDDPSFGKMREPVLRVTHWARAFNINSASALGTDDLSGQYGLIEAADPGRLGQQAYRSPSVFNFYRPGFVAAGFETGNAGLLAPELQITTATSVTSYANYIQNLVQENRAAVVFTPDYAAEMALAEDPVALVNRLNLVLTGGAMTTQTRDAILSAVNSVSIRADNVQVDRRNRVLLAVLMTVLSSEYQIQR